MEFTILVLAFLLSATGFSQSLITSINRQYPGVMFGGWGPNLRGLMRTQENQLWIAIDRGSDVYHNTQIDYYSQQSGKWAYVGSNAQISGVVQNVSSMMIGGRYIYSYGVSVYESKLEECFFDTKNPGYRACNDVTLSGRTLSLSANSNYVGSAVAPDGISRVVWWTQVGENGAGGMLHYIYNFGGGWNGPISSGLGGYNDLGYVYGSLSSDLTFTGAGQFWLGNYPSGAAQATAVQFKLGQSARYSVLGVRSNECFLGTSVKSGSDLYIDPASGSLHILAETFDGQLAYYFAQTSDISKSPPLLKSIIKDTFRARFHAQGNFVYLIAGAAASAKLRIYQIDQTQLAKAVDFRQARKFEISAVNLGAGAPSAIYAETRQHGTIAAKELNFAVVGSYPDSDGKIYHFTSTDLTSEFKSTAVTPAANLLFPAIGSMCGLENHHLTQGWSRGTKCGGHSPSISCPTGYSKASIKTNGGMNTLYSCQRISNLVLNPEGSLCGLSSFNIFNGAQDGSYCGGKSARTSCPVGFQKISVLQNGGYDVLTSCAALSGTAALNSKGMLCGLSNYNISNGYSQVAQCEMSQSPASFSEILEVANINPFRLATNGGIDTLLSCSMGN